MSEIVINFTLQGSSEASSATDNLQPSGEMARENAKTAFTVNRALAVVKQFSTQVVDSSIAQIGARTGNYVMQERAQNTMNVMGKIVGIGTAFVANPILGAVALVGEGVSLGFQVSARNREIIWQNREAEQLRRRAGYNSNYNR